MAVRLQKPRAIAPVIGEFILAKQNKRCSTRTTKDYKWWLDQLAELAPDTPALNSVSLSRFFAGLRERSMKPSSRAKAYRVIGTFLRWCAKKGYVRRSAVDALEDDDLRPKVDHELPDPPTDKEVVAILKVCKNCLKGRRNYAMICIMADAGLRSAEVRNLLVGHFNADERTLIVRSGKGRKDRVCPICPRTVRAIGDYIEMRDEPALDEDGRRTTRPLCKDDYLFAGHRSRPVMEPTGRTRTLRDGRTVQVRELRIRPSRPMGPRHLIAILHRLSKKAGLPEDRWIHPHALRHHAATAWIRKGEPSDVVRRKLGHRSMSTTLVYGNLVAKDLQESHQRAAAFEDVTDD